MARFEIPAPSVNLVVEVDSDYMQVPEWVLRILDAWLHGKLLMNFEGCDVPKPVQKLLYQHFWNKHKLGACTSCLDELLDAIEGSLEEEGKEVKENGEEVVHDVSCPGPHNRWLWCPCRDPGVRRGTASTGDA